MVTYPFLSRYFNAISLLDISLMLTSDWKGHYLLHFTFLGGVVSFLIYRLDSCASASAKECVSSLLKNVSVVGNTVVGLQMDHSCSRVLKILFDFSVPLYSRFNFRLLLNTSIEGNEKKTALERICEWSVVLWKIPLRTSVGQQGWVNNCSSRRRN